MNLKELEYIIKIAEERSFTKAAEKLFITPSALNQQVGRIEKDLGTPLFYRSRSGCIPTEAGEIYIQTAADILRKKKEAYNQIRDLADSRKGMLSIGFPPEHGTSMFTAVYLEFHKQFPDISLQAYEASVRQQQKLIAQGVLDVGFLTLLDWQKTGDEYLHIVSEELLLALPSSSPICQKAVKRPGRRLPELNLNELKDEPFALMYRESTIYEWVDSLFRKHRFVPTVLFETSRSHTILNIISNNMCCGLLSDYYYDPSIPNVSFFCLPDHPTWELAASYKKGSYLSRPAKAFIRLASDYWNSHKFQPDYCESAPLS
ncbi:MAG: LysR family transcriptional regulator [Hungatella sp.]|nr:LysR family transcriptional regulator [Hungatella sp.]